MAILDSGDQLYTGEPQTMHIDLNSAFATIEQQAHPMLRGRPVGVCSYTTPGGIILAASYEAKRLGIGTGTSVREARALCPDIFVMMPDPDKYFYVNSKLYGLLYSYTSDITPLSIDEFVIEFANSRKQHPGSLVKVAKEIKARIKVELGDWMRVNIGIGTNRFLAKTAAGLHKPNGLDVITHHNLRDIYGGLQLRDLCGINYRMETRLNARGIFTPLEFLDASIRTLQKEVYKSIEGYRWHKRLRGWEIDGVVYGRKSFGNDFAMYLPSEDKRELARLLMKLCEKTGRRLRGSSFHANGAHLWLLYQDGSFWHKGNKTHHPLYSTNDIFTEIMRIFNRQPEQRPVTKLGVSVYGLTPITPQQLELFETIATKQRRIAHALDRINDKYGEFAITPALMMNMAETIIKRVPFGASKDLKEVYQQYHQDFRAA